MLFRAAASQEPLGSAGNLLRGDRRGVRVAGSTFGNYVTIAPMDAGDAAALAGRLGFHDIPRTRTRTRRGRATQPAPEPVWSRH